MGFRKAQPGYDSRVRSIKRVLWAVLVLNLLVAAAKLAYGLWSGSVAMQADGFHSLFDGTSNVVGLVGMAAAGRPADSGHPYGHGKYEAYASAIIGAMLLAAAWNVGSAALGRLLDGGVPPRVDRGSFLVMFATLAVNVAVSVYERRRGRILRSDLLTADASHTASDVLVSLGVIGGLLAVRAGFAWADPAIALGVAGCIVLAAWRVFQRVNETLSDQPRMPREEVCRVAEAVPGVYGCHSIRTRGAAAEVCVDLHVQVDPEITVAAGHCIAEAVERALGDAFPEVADVVVHLEPMDRYQERKTADERGDPPP